MKNLLQGILVQVTAAADDLAGVTVSYSAAGGTAVIAGVLLGKDTEQADLTEPGAPRIEYSDRDFLIRSARLTSAGGRIEPHSGDQIVILDEGHPDAGKTFEVMAVDGRCFAMVDPWVVRYRVFTRQVT